MILHIRYTSVITGAILLGMSILTPRVPESAAIHALGIGAAGTMILVVMTRATKRHTGRRRFGDSLTSSDLPPGGAGGRKPCRDRLEFGFDAGAHECCGRPLDR
jgi:hypothetical protein